MTQKKEKTACYGCQAPISPDAAIFVDFERQIQFHERCSMLANKRWSEQKSNMKTKESNQDVNNSSNKQFQTCAICQQQVPTKQSVYIDERGHSPKYFHQICRTNALEMAIDAVGKAVDKSLKENDKEWRKWAASVWSEYSRACQFLSGPSEAPKHEIKKRNQGWLIMEAVNKALRDGAGDQLK